MITEPGYRFFLSLSSEGNSIEPKCQISNLKINIMTHDVMVSASTFGFIFHEQTILLRWFVFLGLICLLWADLRPEITLVQVFCGEIGMRPPSDPTTRHTVLCDV